MKTNITTVAVAIVLGLASPIPSTARADWPRGWHIEIRPGYGYPVYGGYCPPPPPSYPAPREDYSPRSDYPTHLQASYRCGYWAGVEARRNGWARDSHGAFISTGSSWESYFQEGYADGYDCHGMRH